MKLLIVFFYCRSASYYGRYGYESVHADPLRPRLGRCFRHRSWYLVFIGIGLYAAGMALGGLTGQLDYILRWQELSFYCSHRAGTKRIFSKGFSRNLLPVHIGKLFQRYSLLLPSARDGAFHLGSSQRRQHAWTFGRTGCRRYDPFLQQYFWLGIFLTCPSTYWGPMSIPAGFNMWSSSANFTKAAAPRSGLLNSMENIPKSRNRRSITDSFPRIDWITPAAANE